jgi:hypothetical protein
MPMESLPWLVLTHVTTFVLGRKLTFGSIERRFGKFVDFLINMRGHWLRLRIAFRARMDKPA